MLLKINDLELPVYPKHGGFKVTTADLDDAETTLRSVDGTLNRDRIAVKRKISLAWGPLKMDEISQILQMVSPVFFDFYYPDPMIGDYTTKTFYVGDRTTPALFERNGVLYWESLEADFIEK